MFRIPWWIKSWIRQKIPLNPNTAEKKKLYLAITYAITSIVAFNYIVSTSLTPGVTKEEEKYLTQAEKVIISMRSPEAQHIKYKLGFGVISDKTVNRDDLQATIEQRKLNMQQVETATEGGIQ